VNSTDAKARFLASHETCEYDRLAISEIEYVIGSSPLGHVLLETKFREHSPDPRRPLSLGQGMLAGAGAGLCQVVATNPMEVLMITMQTRSAEGAPPHSLAESMRSLGLRGLYRGVSATLARDIPFSMIFFGLNTSLKEHLAQRYQGALPIGAVFGIGILAGTTAAALSTPLDVVKTRIQSGIRDCHGQSYQSVGNALARVVRHEGVRSLWSGALPRMLIVGPLFGITLLFYEVQQRLAQAAHRKRLVLTAATPVAKATSTSA
jgi:hypothetical protein